MSIKGSLDRYDHELIEGWVALTDGPEKKLSLEALLGDQVIGRSTSDDPFCQRNSQYRSATCNDCVFVASYCDIQS